MELSTGENAFHEQNGNIGAIIESQFRNNID